jgi:hypothetical protein
MVDLHEQAGEPAGPTPLGELLGDRGKIPHQVRLMEKFA